MIVIDRQAGQAVQIGPYTLRVLAVHHDEVVIALLGPGEEGTGDEGDCDDTATDLPRLGGAPAPRRHGGAD